MTHKYHVMNQLDEVCTYTFKGEGPRLTRENPAHIILDRDYANFADTLWILRMPEVSAWIYERVTTAEVLRIDMKIPMVEATNFELLRRKIDNDYRRMPYGQIRVHKNGVDTAELTVTHSLHAADVSAERLREVLLGMVWGLQQVLGVADAIEDIKSPNYDTSKPGQNKTSIDWSDDDSDESEEDDSPSSDIPSKLRCPDHS